MAGMLLVAAVATPAPAATAIDVDFTCVGADQGGGNTVTLPTAAHAGDTIRVSYHGCSFVSDSNDSAVRVDSAGLAPSGAFGGGFDLPAPDGVVLLSVVSEPIGGDLLVWFLQSPADHDGTVLMQPYRQPPQFTVRAHRNRGDCRRVTVTLVGIPASEVLRVNIGYLVEVPPSPQPNPIGGGFEGAGGTGSSWSHTYRSPRGYGRFPRKAFRLTVFPNGDFFAGIDILEPRIQKSTKVTAC